MQPQGMPRICRGWGRFPLYYNCSHVPRGDSTGGFGGRNCTHGHVSSSPGSGRLKLTVLSEDRLQMKWKETEGNTSGYKVRVKPMAGTC